MIFFHNNNYFCSDTGVGVTDLEVEPALDTIFRQFSALPCSLKAAMTV